MSLEIRPCPWCDSDDCGPDCDGEWQVECGNCGAVGPMAETAGDAVRAWNEVSSREWENLREHREMMAG